MLYQRILRGAYLWQVMLVVGSGSLLSVVESGCSENKDGVSQVSASPVPPLNGGGGGPTPASGSSNPPLNVLPDPPDAAAPTSDLPLGTATLGGTVWAPGNAPSSVPLNQEIPVAGALVQVSTSPDAPLAEGVSCDQCVAVTGRYTLTDNKGRFELAQLPSGNYWLTVRKGQFALQKQIEILAGESKMLPSAQTTLPSIHAPTLGAWVPRIAVATGAYDGIEQVLGKMGLGTVDADGLWQATGAGADRIDTYADGGEPYSSDKGEISDLVRNLEVMRQYHIIFIPCSNLARETLRDQQVLRNIRQYVSEGGKLYVTDWSGSWHDNVFPEEVTFGGSDINGNPVDTPKSAYDSSKNLWDLSQLGSTEGANGYDSLDARAVDQSLFQWLDGQTAPIDTSGQVATVDASQMTLTDNWNTIEAVNDTVVGLDSSGKQVIDKPKVFVEGSGGLTGDAIRRPMTLTYQPAGCGRVLYSTYHTSQEPHAGLLPQERILLYLIMEISVCRADPVPVVPVVK